MKYLKTYSQRELHYNESLLYNKIFHNRSIRVILPDDMIQEIKDICLELTDQGFEVKVYNKTENQGVVYFCTSIVINKPYLRTTWGDISEVVERVTDYVDSKGYDCMYDTYGSPIAAYNHHLNFIKK